MGVNAAREAHICTAESVAAFLRHEQVDSDLSASGYTGVTAKRDKWQAYITYKGKRYSLGCYSKIEDAVRARAYAKDMVREDARKLLEAYSILHDHDRLLPNAGETATQSRRGA